MAKYLTIPKDQIKDQYTAEDLFGPAALTVWTAPEDMGLLDDVKFWPVEVYVVLEQDGLLYGITVPKGPRLGGIGPIPCSEQTPDDRHGAHEDAVINALCEVVSFHGTDDWVLDTRSTWELVSSSSVTVALTDVVIGRVFIVSRLVVPSHAKVLDKTSGKYLTHEVGPIDYIGRRLLQLHIPLGVAHDQGSN